MQKIKYQVIKKCVEKNITDAELTILFHIAQYQDEQGNVMGLYYRDICSATGLSIQTFYNVLYSLQEKDIITLYHTNNGDYNVTIKDNSFQDNDFSCGYVSLRKKIFCSKEFTALKAHEKLMLIDIVSIAYAGSNKYCPGQAEFYAKYSEMFQVTKRVIRDYLRSIKKLCSFIVCNLKNHQYEFVIKQASKETVQRESDETKRNKSIVKVLCRHNKIKEYTEKELKEAAALIHQYRILANRRNFDIFNVFTTCLCKSLEVINQYKSRKDKKEYTLRYKLIHKLIRMELGIE